MSIFRTKFGILQNPELRRLWIEMAFIWSELQIFSFRLVLANASRTQNKMDAFEREACSWYLLIYGNLRYYLDEEFSLVTDLLVLYICQIPAEREIKNWTPNWSLKKKFPLSLSWWRRPQFSISFLFCFDPQILIWIEISVKFWESSFILPKHLDEEDLSGAHVTPVR